MHVPLLAIAVIEVIIMLAVVESIVGCWYVIYSGSKNSVKSKLKLSLNSHVEIHLHATDKYWINDIMHF